MACQAGRRTATLLAQALARLHKGQDRGEKLQSLSSLALQVGAPSHDRPPWLLPSWPSSRHWSSAAPDAPKQPQPAAPATPSRGLISLLPAAAVPYAQLMRLQAPIGTWLLAWPCFWSIGLATPAGALPDAATMALFGAGAVLLRGAGCTINDLWDRDLDKKVERTKSRPLASGALQPRQAVAFLGAQLLLGLGILLQLNRYTQLLGVASLPLVASYPLMKRITYWPQAVLGATINWGALMGWAAVRGACDWSVVLPLYVAGINWSLVYDTIYAHQDKRDDVSAGVKSTALLFGDRTKQWLSGFATAHVACLALTGVNAGCGALYFAGVAAAAAHMAWQIRTVDLNSGRDCATKFVSNTQYGGIVMSGIMGDKLLPLLLG